jgi:dTDP-4-dehydro-6-deoxy-alpha-D-glucopyranose 2,3-dehydratase
MNINEFLSSYTKDVDEEELILALHNDILNTTSVDPVALNKLDKWEICQNGNIVHESGKFFSIRGGFSTNTETGICNFQPIIDQPEQGVLGFISRVKNNTIEILTQLKMEPGNLGIVQYSPTVQATRSNYSRVHNGKQVAYIDKFIAESDGSTKVIFTDNVVSRGFQSEHGYKFYRKANDNIHVHDNEVEAINGTFVWLSLNDIRVLSKKSNCVNMDMRSVLSTIDFIGRSLSYFEIFRDITDGHELEREFLFSSLSEENSIHSLTEIRTWLDRSKENKKIQSSLISVNDLVDHGWVISDSTIKNDQNKNFELVGIKSTVLSREISSWCQPIVKDNVPKVYLFIIKKINNIFHVLIKLVEEDFGWNGSELGPSIGAIPIEKFNLNKELSKFNIHNTEYSIAHNSMQSEEGGRFMEQENNYMLIVADNNIDVIVDNNYKWVTLYQLKQMTRYECSINIEARTLLSIASYYKK